jgi:hypothetical protein
MKKIVICKVTQTAAANAEESASSIQELAGQANELRSMVEKKLLARVQDKRRISYTEL